MDDAALAQNFYNQAAERALSTFNHTHVLALNWVLASPVDATKGFLSHPAFLAKALKDWTLSGSLTAQTGAPADGHRQRKPGRNRLARRRFAPTRPASPIDSGKGWFNTAAFVTPPAGTFGTAGRDTIIGPGHPWSESFAGAQHQSEFRAAAPGIPHRYRPTSSITSIPSGLITVVNSTQYGEITNAGTMRADYGYPEIKVLNDMKKSAARADPGL